MKRNDAYFILSLISLGLSVFFLPLSVYILPSVWFGWVYHLPDFVYTLKNSLQYVLGLSENVAGWAEFDLFFLLFFLFAVLTYTFSSQARVGLENASKKIVDTDEKAIQFYRRKQEQREAVFMGIKIALILVAVFIIADIMHRAISLTRIQQNADNLYNPNDIQD